MRRFAVAAMESFDGGNTDSISGSGYRRRRHCCRRYRGGKLRAVKLGAARASMRLRTPPLYRPRLIRAIIYTRLGAYGAVSRLSLTTTAAAAAANATAETAASSPEKSEATAIAGVRAPTCQVGRSASARKRSGTGIS